MKNLSKYIWPLVGLVCVAIAGYAVVSAANTEGFNSAMLIFCAAMFIIGGLGATNETVKAWKQ